jgi:response regulator of citrate/malate metabolism
MIRVLVVDDQPMVATVHREMVNGADGFRAVAVAHNGRTALARVVHGDIDLVLLDLTMPGMDGLEVCRRLHAMAEPPDVIVVTAVRDMTAVHAAVRHGAALYIVKPFTACDLRERLRQYASFRRSATAGTAVDQKEIDQALATLRVPAPPAVPKSLSPESLDAVRTVLREARETSDLRVPGSPESPEVPEGLTASEAAERTGMARVTARRYLEHLVTDGICVREPVYGRTGRPLLRYRLRD